MVNSAPIFDPHAIAMAKGTRSCHRLAHHKGVLICKTRGAVATVYPKSHGPQEQLIKNNTWACDTHVVAFKSPQPGLVDSRLPHLGERGQPSAACRLKGTLKRQCSGMMLGRVGIMLQCASWVTLFRTIGEDGLGTMLHYVRVLSLESAPVVS